MTQKNLKQEIFRLASANVAPREIEQTLDLPPYQIHVCFHHDLMRGYLKANQTGLMNTLGNKSEKTKELEKKRKKLLAIKREKERERSRKYRAKHLEKIREMQRKYKQRKAAEKREENQKIKVTGAKNE
ncbi:hypothetical protein A4V04_00630 [Burkholderiales bacterium YL45]|uniref:Uncharacterized protein n=1 Tax=Turicimonas muris TaxID=1796652 RepID=A0A227KS85_9BURK|nr:hypothetical protein [Turicimonas muris]ANU65084.1 hypothetical protein A4V04_00630 [Burkholderiales bacterium YL45]OXE50885.1 hypothetical protein ADH67_00860 [Turicimonas muris]QQQ96244.1 hypothetical protein I5Q81_09785 [Turicimonas muris]